jgi:hypothetical protein
MTSEVAAVIMLHVCHRKHCLIWFLAGLGWAEFSFG